MPKYTQIQSFNSDWQKMAAWAQSQGISYDKYFPIWKADAARVQAGDYSMSNAERERAILAAHDPKTIQRVPQDNPNPWNIFGNVQTDLRNIFTGIGDIVIHPLHNGLVDPIKNTFDLFTGAHHLAGNSTGAKIGDALNNTVLSFLPGAADIGTVLQADPTALSFGPDKPGQDTAAGIRALAQHPLASVLDLLPVSKELGTLAAGGRIGERAGITAAEADKGMTVGQLAYRALRNKPLDKAGLSMRDGPQFTMNMTVGDVIDGWKAKTLHTNKALTPAWMGLETGSAHATRELGIIIRDTAEAMNKLTPAEREEVNTILQKQGTHSDLIASGSNERVRHAVELYFRDVHRMYTEEGILSNDVHVVRNPTTGKLEVYSTKGHPTVIAARDAAHKAYRDWLDVAPAAIEIRQQLGTAEDLLFTHTAQLEQANAAARQITLGEGETWQGIPLNAKRPAGMSKNANLQRMTAPGGMIDTIVTNIRDGRYDQAFEQADIMAKRFGRWWVNEVDINDPSFTPQQRASLVALKNEVQNVHDATRAVREINRRAEKQMLTEAKETDPRFKAYKKATLQQHREMMAGAVMTVEEQRVATLKNLRNSYKQMEGFVERDATEQIQRLRDAAKREKDRQRIEFERQKEAIRDRHWNARRTNAWRMEYARRELGDKIPSDPMKRAEAGYLADDMLVVGSPRMEQMELEQLTMAHREYMAQIDNTLRQATEPIVQEMKDRKDELAKRYEAARKEASDAYKKDADRFREGGDEYKRTRKEAEAEIKAQKKAFGPVMKAARDVLEAQKKFSKAVWDHPPDVYVDVKFNTMVDMLVKQEATLAALAKAEKRFSEKHGTTPRTIEELRSNPHVVGQLAQMALHNTLGDASVYFSEADLLLMRETEKSAMDFIDRMRRDPDVVLQYVPHVSESQIEALRNNDYGIHIIAGKGIPTTDMAEKRAWDMSRSRFDAMAAGNHALMQRLEQQATIEYMEHTLSNYVQTGTQLQRFLFDIRPDLLKLKTAMSEGATEAERKAQISTINSELEKLAKQMRMVKWDPNSMFGFTLPRWTDPEGLYIPEDLANGLKRLAGPQPLWVRSLSKPTNLFRFAILNLSPRYTAHILFGGTFLLALRSSPEALRFIGTAHKALKTGEGLPEDLMAPQTQAGTPDYGFRQPMQEFQYRSGKEQGRFVLQEIIETKLGIKLDEAKAVHWLKAAGQANLRFTSYVTNMQRTIAYLDGAAKAERKGYFIDPETGEKVSMTKERMAYEGMKHAGHVMGDLRKMGPLERQAARTVIPFYGWQKHILSYVLSYPIDHPWRAMMLANMAEYDNGMIDQQGLPLRWQFLFYLGHPDAQGNVTAADLRALNPLRDVANYATLTGYIQSLNPVITSTFTFIDPSLVYGENTLYPKTTYDQFYGINVAGSQGNLGSIAQQFVPEVQGIGAAMALANSRFTGNKAQVEKKLLEAMNVPFVPQSINITQEIAKTSDARYQTAKNMADQYMQNQIPFSAIAGLGSVPDPRQAGYQISVADLKMLHDELEKMYPGAPPSANMTPLAAPKL
jgi:hypothetical protein